MTGTPASGVPDAGPPLPPSPMTPDHALPKRPAPPALPWYTPALTGLAGAVGGLLWWQVYSGLATLERLHALVLGCALMGLGVCALDRRLSSWPRGVRWMHGMAAGSIVPIAHVIPWLWMPGAPLYGGPMPLLARAVQCAIGIAVAVAGLAVPGLTLGLLAGRRRGRWLMPLAGLVVMWVASEAAISLGLPGLDDGYCELLMAGSYAQDWVNDCSTFASGLLGLCLGLAFAVADWRAEERDDPLPRAPA